MGYLWEPLGLVTADGHEILRDRKTVLVMVLIKSPMFPWDGGVLGYTIATSWIGWDSETHWTLTACTLWSHIQVPSIAHELGHCFRLDHNGADDSNFDGVDNTVDLMVRAGVEYHSPRLQPSNQERVDQHFRILADNADLALSGQPQIRVH